MAGTLGCGHGRQLRTHTLRAPQWQSYVVTLDIDPTRAARSLQQVRSLVRAVYGAAPEDESRAIEWKSNYADLTSTEASFAIGRAILGLANRPVTVAAASFEGVGYVLVGVEPGLLIGQQVPDSAELLNAVHRYTGHGWPHWDARTVDVDDVSVLVITVEPPRGGDRIALLHKSYQGQRGQQVQEGTIFVRQPGATERASRTEIEMLQDRLLSGSDTEGAASRESLRRAELRETVSDLVQAGNSWSEIMEILIISTASGQWKQRDWVEWANSDSGRAMTANVQLFDRSVRRLRLTSGEERLVLPAQAAQASMKKGEVFDVLHSGGSTGEGRVLAYRELNTLRAALLTLEQNAVNLLATSAE